MRVSCASLVALALLAACSGGQGGSSDGEAAADAGGPDATTDDAELPADAAPADAGGDDTNTSDANASDANPPDAPKVQLPPSTKDTSIRLELGDSLAADLSGTDPDGDALTFSIVTSPTQGQISALDPATGKFTYTSTVLTAGTDSFTFQVNDGTSNAPTPGTVHVDIDPVLFTGYWQLTNVTDNGAACSNGSFRLGQGVPVGGASGFVEVSQHGFSCGNTSYSFVPMQFDYSMGTVTDASIKRTQSQFISGCGTVTDAFELTKTATGFVYTETVTTPCLAGGPHVITGKGTLTPSAYLSLVPSALAFGRVYQGDPASQTMTVRNIGKLAATGLTIGAPTAPFSFLGGSYPGTGGTCTNQVPGSASCALVFGLSTAGVGDATSSVSASYTDAMGTATAAGSMSGSVEPKLANVTAISAGNGFQCALQATGIVCWGSNTYGQSTVPTLTSPTAIDAGDYHACAIDAAGVHCWGSGGSGQTTVPALANPKSVSAGGSHTCALDDTGVHCWGANGSGQSTVPALATPTAVSAGGAHTCALDGTGVHCWGSNAYGQTTVPALSNPTSISAGGNHTCALDDTGVHCWGYNIFGQSTVPALTSPTSVSAGGLESCAVVASGLQCWGFEAAFTPTLTSPTSVSGGYNHFCAVTGGNARCWGSLAYP